MARVTAPASRLRLEYYYSAFPPPPLGNKLGSFREAERSFDFSIPFLRSPESSPGSGAALSRYTHRCRFATQHAIMDPTSRAPMQVSERTRADRDFHEASPRGYGGSNQLPNSQRLHYHLVSEPLAFRSLSPPPISKSWKVRQGLMADHFPDRGLQRIVTHCPCPRGDDRGLLYVICFLCHDCNQMHVPAAFSSRPCLAV
jgi:hypothetical protein